MVRLSFKQRLRLSLFERNSKTVGFTLVELLVAMLIAGFIGSALLFLVVQLVQTNFRQAARSDTQRDLQSAIDYITRDLREAVYVYDGNCLDVPTDPKKCPGLKNYLPQSISQPPNNDNVPVLAFWRVDPIPQALLNLCIAKASAYSNQPATALPLEIQGIPCLSRRMYTLIVYSLNWSSGTPAWQGRARITRYELPQFPDSASSAIFSKGWADPMSPSTDFLTWPLDKNKFGAGVLEPIPPIQNGDTPAGTNRVLVDFADKLGVNGATCPSTEYVQTPKAPIGNARGFYVCVRGAADGANLNQEVLVRIQGDAAGRPGIPLTSAVPISLETRVLTRGVVNKTQ